LCGILLARWRSVFSSIFLVFRLGLYHVCDCRSIRGCPFYGLALFTYLHWNFSIKFTNECSTTTQGAIYFHTLRVTDMSLYHLFKWLFILLTIQSPRTRGVSVPLSLRIKSTASCNYFVLLSRDKMASHLSSGPVNLGVLRESYRRELLECLDRCTGSKVNNVSSTLLVIYAEVVKQQSSTVLLSDNRVSSPLAHSIILADLISLNARESIPGFIFPNTFRPCHT
jgi:hypothetical protein